MNRIGGVSEEKAHGTYTIAGDTIATRVEDVTII